MAAGCARPPEGTEGDDPVLLVPRPRYSAHVLSAGQQACSMSCWPATLASAGELTLLADLTWAQR
jgi:hypothetical protein